MRYSQLLLPTLRQLPKDADTVSARLMLRAGMIRKVASGLYEWLPMGLKVLKKVEQIVREEMDAVGGQEVWLPVIQPKELWEETGRWGVYGKELLRLQDRKNAEFCVAPTAEEVVTDLVRNNLSSYRQLPLFLYQFGTKFRDEIRPRFGVMRAREFYMKDGYSFHADEADIDAFYGKIVEAYRRVFERCALDFRKVEADSGAIGGDFSHEFMVLADTGESDIASCEACGYGANTERAELSPPPDANGAIGESAPIEEIHTPGSFKVDDVAKLLKRPSSEFIKTLFFEADGRPVVALLRGDHELNEIKLKNKLGAKQFWKAKEETYRSVAGCAPGFAGPQGLKDRNPDLIFLADHAVKGVRDAVSGANKDDHHATGINPGRDFEPDRWEDLRLAVAGDPCPKCSKPMKIFRGIEVGHTFKLGTVYSSKMKATFLDPSQKPRTMIMGCYGIGVSRVVAATIEQCHDENGICWPLPLAPFSVEVVSLDPDIAEVHASAEKLYDDLRARGLSVLLDDRAERPGVKFKDADLIGAPVRVLVSRRNHEKGVVEFKRRSSKDSETVPAGEAVAKTLELLKH